MNQIVVTVCGNIATDPKHQITKNGQPLTSFRLASTPRRFDPEVQGYVDGETTWLSVSCWGALAFNTNGSLGKGQPVVVHGSLRTRDWESDEKSGRDIELTAFSVGHDLRRGRSTFERVTRSGTDRMPARASVGDLTGEADPADDPAGDASEVAA